MALKSGKSSQMINILDFAQELLQWSTVAPDFDSEVVIERMLFGVDGYSAWTQVLSNPKRPVFFNFRGGVLSLGVGLFKGALEDHRWTKAWLLGRLLRQEGILETLSETRKEVVSPDFLEGVSQYADVSYLLFEMFFEHKGIHPESLDAILDVIENGENEAVPEGMSSQQVSLFFIPSYFKAMKALHAKDAEAFEQHFYHALEEHKTFWSEERTLQEGGTSLHVDPDGFHSLYFTQLLAQAADHGIHPDVESEYMAEWVLMEV